VKTRSQKSEVRSEKSGDGGQPGATLNSQLPNSQLPVRGDFLMTVGDGSVTVQVGNLTAGELCWLGQLVELMCDPAKAQQWADFKTKARFLAYTEGALEYVSAQAIANTHCAATVQHLGALTSPHHRN
jgi:hypothetical protein